MSINGEFIYDGNMLLGADGDIGDVGHEAIIIQNICGEYKDELVNNGKELLEKIENSNDEILDKIEDIVEPDFFKETIESLENDYGDEIDPEKIIDLHRNCKELDELLNVGLSWSAGIEEAIKILHGGDARLYGVKKYGYIIIRDNSFELWGWNERNAKNVMSAIYEIVGEELNDPNDDLWNDEIDIHDYATGKAYTMTVKELHDNPFKISSAPASIVKSKHNGQYINPMSAGGSQNWQKHYTSESTGRTTTNVLTINFKEWLTISGEYNILEANLQQGQIIDIRWSIANDGKAIGYHITNYEKDKIKKIIFPTRGTDGKCCSFHNNQKAKFLHDTKPETKQKGSIIVDPQPCESCSAIKKDLPHGASLVDNVLTIAKDNKKTIIKLSSPYSAGFQKEDVERAIAVHESLPSGVSLVDDMLTIVKDGKTTKIKLQMVNKIGIEKVIYINERLPAGASLYNGKVTIVKDGKTKEIDLQNGNTKEEDLQNIKKGIASHDDSIAATKKLEDLLRKVRNGEIKIPEFLEPPPIEKDRKYYNWQRPETSFRFTSKKLGDCIVDLGEMEEQSVKDEEGDHLYWKTNVEIFNPPKIKKITGNSSHDYESPDGMGTRSNNYNITKDIPWSEVDDEDIKKIALDKMKELKEYMEHYEKEVVPSYDIEVPKWQNKKSRWRKNLSPQEKEILLHKDKI